ncbi:MAG: 4-alpha-glucanotransferase [Pseudomonadota bacterium]
MSSAGGDSNDATLLTLAETHGILPTWIDLSGQRHVTSPETALALLRAMGVLDAPSEASDRLAAHRAAQAARPLPRAVAIKAGTPALLEALGPDQDWTLTLEAGEGTGGRASEGKIALPALPMGLHRLFVGPAETLVIAAPSRAPSVADRLGRDRAWGVTGALAALWHGEPPGADRIGTYDTLATAAEALAPLGAAFLGINPVHALGWASDTYSPYSPGHRGFFDPRPLLQVGGEGQTAEALIDFTAHRAAHDSALRAQFAAEQADPARQSAFSDWRAQLDPNRAEALAAFALFEALSKRFGPDWSTWPAGHETPDAPAARAYAAANPEALAFHAWVQWQAETALGHAQDRARAAGMGLGLYLDLAVGVRPDGAEVWARPGVFARGVSLGAPPDQFSPTGQDWGLAPFAPPGLAAGGYSALIETLRAAMAHAGMLRIDHVLGLERTFWVPRDGTPGGYVRSDRDVLLAIVRLEAARAGCVVVGEDLGVVPDGLREALAGTGLYGCSVAMFEHWEGKLRAPWHFRAETLASFGTHDTPTLRGWWEGRDIDWAVRLGRAGPDDAAAMRARRATDRGTLMALLAEAWILPEGLDPAAPPERPDASLIDAVHALMARASAALIAVQIDDVLGTLEQPNIPGTIDEHPNWRRRHAVDAAALASHPSLQRIAEEMRALGRA